MSKFARIPAHVLAFDVGALKFDASKLLQHMVENSGVRDAPSTAVQLVQHKGASLLTFHGITNKNPIRLNKVS
jgi:hypothetical protein